MNLCCIAKLSAPVITSTLSPRSTGVVAAALSPGDGCASVDAAG